MVRLVALALVVCGAVACCSTKPVVPAAEVPVDSRNAAERAEAKSVAVADTEGNVVCGGVWVGPATILTSHHCVKDNGKPALDGMLEMLGADADVLPPWDSTGQPAPYVDKAGTRHAALVARIDPKDDLALLGALPPVPDHDIARVSVREMHDGEELDIVGSTFGLPFSYSRAYVGSTRGAYLQVSGPVWRGNSGGGAFDYHGDLVGIADHITGVVTDEGREYVPCLSFFVRASTIRAFMAGS